MGVDWTAVGEVIGGVGAWATVFVQGRGNHRDAVTKLEEVKTEVKTSNAQTIAQLADATETRRVSEIPEADRTPGEQAHLHEVPPTG